MRALLWICGLVSLVGSVLAGIPLSSNGGQLIVYAFGGLISLLVFGWMAEMLASARSIADRLEDLADQAKPRTERPADSAASSTDQRPYQRSGWDFLTGRNR